jgi:ketosteroid isomerase-like protein
VPSPGQAVTQKPAIRSALQQFLAAKVPIKLTVRQVFESGDTALLIVDWSMNGTTPDGKAMDLAGSGSDVVKKKKDGTWVYVINNPFGTLNPGKKSP